MKTLASVLTGFMVLSLTTSAVAADDIKKMLVGKWEAVKVDEGTIPLGTVVKFTADGKMEIIVNMGGKENKIEGTYTVDGKAFTYKVKIDDNERSQKITVEKITDTELDTANPEGKKVSFKKAK